MNLRAATLVLAVCITGCATPRQNEWLWHGLNAVDGLETMSRCEGVQESNPMLGSDPSDGEVAVMLVGWSILYHYLNKWVADNDPEHLKAFQYLTIGIKSVVVVNNAATISGECW